MVKRPNKVLPISSFHDLMAHDERGVRTWATAPLSCFASDGDHRRWNARFAGMAVDEVEGAFRVRVIETPHAKRRWHVEIAVGAQRFSLSSHDDREVAERDASLFATVIPA